MLQGLQTCWTSSRHLGLTPLEFLLPIPNHCVEPAPIDWKLNTESVPRSIELSGSKCVFFATRCSVPGPATSDNRKSPHRECPKAFYLYWHGEESEIHRWERRQIRHVLDDRNFIFQQNAVHRTAQILDVVDVVGID